METSFTKRYTFKALISLSLILGIIFFYVDHIDFISSAIEYGKMNVSNIGYALLRIVGGIFIPAIFIIPSMFEYARIRLTKICFIVYGACHLLTLSWIIYFLFTQPAGQIFDPNKVTEFLFNGGYVYQITFWDTYGLISVLFSIIYGIAAIYTGMKFDKEKETVKWLLVLLLALRLLLPFLNNIFFQGRVYSLRWITTNYLELASQLSFTLAVFLAAIENSTWIEFVWDQMIFPENEDEE
ncbi:MAG: hypothetical protein IK057_05715 [Clostridia bacterium]|nr:hypothetical protein [Clostridia bacterium]